MDGAKALGTLRGAAADAAMREVEARAELDNHADQIASEVRKLRDLRCRIQKLEDCGESHQACTTSFDLRIDVATADVLDAMRMAEENLRRSITKHLEVVAGYVEKR